MGQSAIKCVFPEWKTKGDGKSKGAEAIRAASLILYLVFLFPCFV